METMNILNNPKFPKAKPAYLKADILNMTMEELEHTAAAYSCLPMNGGGNVVNACCEAYVKQGGSFDGFYRAILALTIGGRSEK